MAIEPDGSLPSNDCTSSASVVVAELSRLRTRSVAAAVTLLQHDRPRHDVHGGHAERQPVVHGRAVQPRSTRFRHAAGYSGQHLRPHRGGRNRVRVLCDPVCAEREARAAGSRGALALAKSPCLTASPASCCCGCGCSGVRSGGPLSYVHWRSNGSRFSNLRRAGLPDWDAGEWCHGHVPRHPHQQKQVRHKPCAKGLLRMRAPAAGNLRSPVWCLRLSSCNIDCLPNYVKVGTQTRCDKGAFTHTQSCVPGDCALTLPLGGFLPSPPVVNPCSNPVPTGTAYVALLASLACGSIVPLRKPVYRCVLSICSRVSPVCGVLLCRAAVPSLCPWLHAGGSEDQLQQRCADRRARLRRQSVYWCPASRQRNHERMHYAARTRSVVQHGLQCPSAPVMRLLAAGLSLAGPVAHVSAMAAVRACVCSRATNSSAPPPRAPPAL